MKFERKKSGGEDYTNIKTYLEIVRDKHYNNNTEGFIGTKGDKG